MPKQKKSKGATAQDKNVHKSAPVTEDRLAELEKAITPEQMPSTSVELHEYYPGWGLPRANVSEDEYVRICRDLDFAEIRYRVRTTLHHFIEVLEGQGYKG